MVVHNTANMVIGVTSIFVNVVFLYLKSFIIIVIIIIIIIIIMMMMMMMMIIIIINVKLAP